VARHHQRCRRDGPGSGGVVGIAEGAMRRGKNRLVGTARRDGEFDAADADRNEGADLEEFPFGRLGPGDDAPLAAPTLARRPGEVLEATRRPAGGVCMSFDK
jgi:hypothetical protein